LTLLCVTGPFFVGDDEKQIDETTKNTNVPNNIKISINTSVEPQSIQMNKNQNKRKICMVKKAAEWF
jgi:hypothetical protein